MSEQTHSLADTIVACATPVGQGAIAIVRVSGPRALGILNLLAPDRRRAAPREMGLARLLDDEGVVIDKAMVVEMLQPKTYTGEDSVELHLHGSMAVVHAAIERVVELGARLADPGEFTLRAYLNGRMTLAEAEGIADVVVSHNDAQRRVASRHMLGEFSSSISEMLEGVEEVLSEVTAACDFPDDVILEALRSEQREVLGQTLTNLRRLIENSRVGFHERRRVVLCGAPNVGKSTLANALAGEKRVLVDPEPGTTRDPVEIPMETGQGGWLLVDTAGLRGDALGLEAQGVEMSLERIRKADVVVWLVDPEEVVWPGDEIDVDLVIGGKADLASDSDRAEIERRAGEEGFEISGWFSGLVFPSSQELRNELTRLFDEAPSLDEIVVVRHRHVEALRGTEAALTRVLSSSDRELPLDLVAIELRAGARALGEILGRSVDAAVLDRIFSSFCLGK